MIDFGKMYCNLHPHELITNFCNKDQCLIGLCANCICTHTQLHVQKGTCPEYENIRDTYKKIQDNLRMQIELFEDDKERIEKVKSKIVEKRLKVRQIIDLAKKQVLTVLGAYFDQKEKKMLLEIQTQQKKYGLHCHNRLESLGSYIAREVSCLISASQELTSNNFLQSMPRIRSQSLVNSQKLHNQIENEIKQNQNFNTNISFNQGMVAELTTTMERSISLQFSGMVYNQRLQQREENIPRRPSSQGKTLTRNLSSQVVNSSFIPNMKQSNIQSQLNINYQPSYFPQNSTNGFRAVGQPQKTSYLSQIPGPDNNMRRQPEKVNNPRVPTSEVNTAKPPEVYSQANHSYIPYNNYSLPVNTNTRPQNNIVNIQQRPLSNRDHEKPYSRSLDKPYNSNIIQPVFNPIHNLNAIHANKPLEKSSATGMNKKCKRSGLKLFTTTEIDSIDSTIHNEENLKPNSQLF